MNAVEGFWLPREIRAKYLSQGLEFSSQTYRLGKPCLPEDQGSVTATWPRLTHVEWQQLLDLLRANRSRVPSGAAFWERLQSALNHCSVQLAEAGNPFHQHAIGTLSSYTGFSEPMVRSTLSAFQMLSLQAFPAVYQSLVALAAARSWQTSYGNPGRWRYFHAPLREKIQSYLPLFSSRHLHSKKEVPRLVVGFGAGNVPGNALLITLLSLASTLAGELAPAVLIRNSRQEPIFTPMVLDAIEHFDPDLLCSTAIMVWDYEDSSLQELLLSQADLVVAAASDETIGHIQAQIHSLHRAAPLRFHAHGHKVSFAAIGNEMFNLDLGDQSSARGNIETISFLAALDSIYWDQFGCLSARLHFVENRSKERTNSVDYCQFLGQHLKVLSQLLPRGSWPRQSIHNSFDRYRQLETTGKVKVFSAYDDDFLLVHDGREFNPATFVSQVNECQGRIIIVRPVNDLDEIHQRYLRCIPPSQLQSMSVAVGLPGENLDARFLRFAEGCGRRGITAIRTVGRAAFPQLAYSWDGLLPLDLAYERSDGYFTTIEFDRPYEQILENYRLMAANWMGRVVPE